MGCLGLESVARFASPHYKRMLWRPQFPTDLPPALRQGATLLRYVAPETTPQRSTWTIHANRRLFEIAPRLCRLNAVQEQLAQQGTRECLPEVHLHRLSEKSYGVHSLAGSFRISTRNRGLSASFSPKKSNGSGQTVKVGNAALEREVVSELLCSDASICVDRARVSSHTMLTFAPGAVVVDFFASQIAWAHATITSQAGWGVLVKVPEEKKGPPPNDL